MKIKWIQGGVKKEIRQNWEGGGGAFQQFKKLKGGGQWYKEDIGEKSRKWVAACV